MLLPHRERKNFNLLTAQSLPKADKDTLSLFCFFKLLASTVTNKILQGKISCPYKHSAVGIEECLQY